MVRRLCPYFRTTANMPYQQLWPTLLSLSLHIYTNFPSSSASYNNDAEGRQPRTVIRMEDDIHVNHMRLDMIGRRASRTRAELTIHGTSNANSSPVSDKERVKFKKIYVTSAC